MAYSDVSICNLAIGRIAAGQQIASLTEQSRVGVACNTYYAHVRDRILYEVDWPFARVYATLNQVGINPNLDWSYSYRVPSDCLRMRRITTPAGREETLPPPFIISQDVSGQLLFCDDPNGMVVYTQYQTLAGVFSPGFADALAWGLAVELAAQLTVTAAKVQTAQKMYDMAIANAIRATLQEAGQDPQVDSEDIRARNGGVQQFDFAPGVNSPPESL